MTVSTKEGTNARQVGHEEEMDEVDVQGASAYILKGAPYPCHLCEILVIVPEIHKDNGEQDEFGQCHRQIGPLEA